MGKTYRNASFDNYEDGNRKVKKVDKKHHKVIATGAIDDKFKNVSYRKNRKFSNMYED